MILTIASGKGGTGKTTLAVNLALLLAETMPVAFLDCDVEEPNAHLFLKPTIETCEQVALPEPIVDKARCDGCGKCAEICAFNAILAFGDQVLTFPELCHGCGGCALLCPEEAITEEPRGIGVLETGWADRIRFIHGRVDIGMPLATPVVKAVRKRAKDTDGLVIVDAPPGTSCPVVASVKDSDYCLLVTEPTPFGLNDLELAVGMARELKVPFGVVINRAGLGDDKVADYCAREGIPILLEVPFDRRYAACYARGGQLVREFPKLQDGLRKLWLRIRMEVGGNGAGAACHQR
jgi:MinD superfamily P-loop ATPase